MVKVKKGRGKYSNAKTGVFRPLHPEKYVGGYPIEYKSWLEYRMMCHCDRERSIVFWAYEKTIIKYYDRSVNPPKVRDYHIDFTIYVPTAKFMNTRSLSDCRKILVEVKDSRETNPKLLESKNPRERATRLKNECKWNAAKEVARAMGCDFRVITDKELK